MKKTISFFKGGCLITHNTISTFYLDDRTVEILTTRLYRKRKKQYLNFSFFEACDFTVSRVEREYLRLIGPLEHVDQDFRRGCKSRITLPIDKILYEEREGNGYTIWISKLDLKPILVAFVWRKAWRNPTIQICQLLWVSQTNLTECQCT